MGDSIAKGLLKVIGDFEVDQFWPTKESDADTININVNQGSFSFSPDPKSKPFRVTHAFENTRIKGARPAIRKGEMTIRLQGIDAPELHFAALLPRKGGPKLAQNGTRFRQRFGETSTVKLHEFVAKSPGRTMKCEVTTVVDKPNDVFDVYGRFIGDVLITRAGKQVNLNHWLVENGWAFPTYYNSMLKTEIRAFQKLSALAKKKGIVPHLTGAIGVLDRTLVFRPHGTPNPKADVGETLMPKLFRRQVRFTVSDLNNIAVGNFRNYLSKLKDPWVTVRQFLSNPRIRPPTNQKNLSPLVSTNNVFGKDPGDIVFFEKPSTLVNVQTGKKVAGWF